MDALTRAEDSAAAAPDIEGAASDVEKKQNDFKAGHGEGDEDDSHVSDENALAQIIGVAILEFGVVLHRHVSMCLGPPSFISPRLTTPSPCVAS